MLVERDRDKRGLGTYVRPIASRGNVTKRVGILSREQPIRPYLQVPCVDGELRNAKEVDRVEGNSIAVSEVVSVVVDQEVDVPVKWLRVVVGRVYNTSAKNNAI
jgi:hypothetical protein